MPDDANAPKLPGTLQPGVQSGLIVPGWPEAAKFDTVGLTGLRRFSGFISEEWHPQLRNEAGIRIYIEMRDNDATIGAVLHAVEILMRAAEWRVKAADASNEAERAREWLEGALTDMSHTWEDLVSEVLSMLVFGWSWTELVYKIRQGPRPPNFIDSAGVEQQAGASRYDDRKFGWRKIEIRAQESWYRWEFDARDGHLAGFWQIPAPDYRQRYLPIEKSVLFRTRSQKGNPEGRSILRTCYRSWYFLKRLQELQAIGAERDLVGLPVVFVPPQVLFDGAYTAQLTTLKKLVSEVRRDEREGVLFPAKTDPQGNPTGWDFQLMTSGGSRQINLEESIRSYKADITTTALADFLRLGLDKVGSFALASSKTHLFAVALSAWLRVISGAFNRYAIPRLWELNGFPPETMPAMEAGDVESPPLDELGAFLRDAVGAGILMPDAELERDVRQKAKLPPPEEDDGSGLRSRQQRELERVAEEKARREQKATEAEAPPDEEEA